MTTQSEAAIQALEAWSRNDQERRRAMSITLSEPEKHEDWCDSVTKMLTSLPPKPAPCNCKRKEPEQEPVAFNAGVPLLYPEMKDGETISVEYTTPPAAQPRPYIRSTAEGTHHCALSQRQWVGLTNEQIKTIEKMALTKNMAIAMTTATLKEKNT